MTAFTPVQLRPDTLVALHAANPKRYPVLLQSAALGEPLGSFDILFACPGDELVLEANGKLRVSGEIEIAQTFLATLDRWWLRERASVPRVDLPFHGGWFLFLGYELAQEIEPSLTLPQSRVIARAVRFPAALIVRHRDRTAWIVTEQMKDLNERVIAADLQSVPSDVEYPNSILSRELIEEPDQRYMNSVNRVLSHIAAGDIYQANLSRRWHGTLTDGVRPHDVYRRLCRANPAPFAALAVFGDHAIVSSSPERLVEARGDVVSTRPIAGTRPRRSDRSDDADRLRELHAHPKERAEHVMLIDLERNDLGRICRPGTVEVDEFMTLESYAHVHHIVSSIRGTLRDDVTPGQIIAAIFPGGTITGCPKIRCMQIIAELEQAARGAYTGSIGYLNLDGSMDLNILIRSIEIQDREVSFRAGAGIVADSVPERELEETRAKARGLIQALVS